MDAAEVIRALQSNAPSTEVLVSYENPYGTEDIISSIREIKVVDGKLVLYTTY